MVSESGPASHPISLSCEDSLFSVADSGARPSQETSGFSTPGVASLKTAAGRQSPHATDTQAEGHLPTLNGLAAHFQPAVPAQSGHPQHQHNNHEAATHAHQQPQQPAQQQGQGVSHQNGASQVARGLSALNVNAPAFVPGAPASHTPPQVNGSAAFHPSPDHMAPANGSHFAAEGAQWGSGDMGFGGAAGYGQGGWGKGAFEGYGYEQYGYGYSMTADGMFVPQQMDAWSMDPAMAQAVYPRRSPNSARSLGKQTQEVSAAVAVLLEQFPLYNRDSLMDVLKVNNFDLANSLDLLAQLETEQTGHRKHLQQAPPKLDHDNFPSLAMNQSPMPSPPGAQASELAPALDGPADGRILSSSSSGSMEGSAEASPSAADSKPARGGQEGPAAWGGAAAARSAAWAGSAQGSFADQARKPGMAPETPQNGASLRQHSPSSQQPQQQRSVDRPSTGGSKASRHKQAMPWVDTGAAVAGQYAEAREEARDHARLRNMYFQQATQAYLAGNKAAAKELGAKGREHSEQMKKAHAAASENIFQQRNSRLQSAAVFNKNGTIMLDLHGLHVSEGLKILSREISQLQSNSKGRVPVKVNILTGTGHHTKASAGFKDASPATSSSRNIPAG
eukprot:jgi/Astpho2/9151/Aster-x0843